MRGFIGYVGGLYVVLALAATWPLATRLDDALPLGCNRSATVPLVSAWALWWTEDRLEHGLVGYWDAPIFYPVKGAFAFSEPMPLLGVLVAPVFALGGSPALAHNVALLLALWLNGLLGYALCRELRLSRVSSAFGGGLMVMLPYVHHQLGVLALVPLFGIEATLLFVLRTSRRPSLSSGACLGLSVAALVALCLQHALMFLVALTVASPLLLSKRALRPRAAGALALAVVIAAAISVPQALAHHRALSAQHFERSVERGEHGSAGVRTWLRTPYRDALPLPGIRTAKPATKRSLFPGAARVLLALVGVAFGMSLGRRRRTWFFVVLVAVSVCLSVLGNLRLGAVSVYELARDAIPGLSAVRSVWRAGVVAQVGVMVLAAQGLHALLHGRPPRWLGRRLSGRSFEPWRAIVGALTCMLALLELWPPAQRLSDTPAARDFRGLAGAVHAHARPGEPLLLLPVPKNRAERSYELTARFMYATAFLDRPWVNGYSSYSPEAYRRFRVQLAKEGAHPRAATLRSTGAAHVVVARAQAPALELPVGYRRVYADGALELWTAAQPLP